MPIHFNNPFKNLTLHRFPTNNQQNLQAWDAADEYLVDHLSNKETLENTNILIFNDSFGALGLSLYKYQPDIITDSIVSELGILANCERNKIDSQKVTILNSLTDFQKKYDYLLIKVPKTLDYLRYFLAEIRPFIHENSKVIIAGMIKSMPKTVWNILEDVLGATTTSLAKKKARLIFVNPEKHKATSIFPTHFIQEETGYKIFNHANVFSKQSLDIGTRFLLQNLPRLNKVNSIIDLGCGNGVVGINLAKAYPQAYVVFTDESYMAVASAKLTAECNLPSTSQYQFIVNNCLDGFDARSVDLIVCNPPFHQSHSIGLHIALRMFQQAYETLNSGGHFIVIGNRHLPYYTHLKRIFGKVKNIASNTKFSLFLSFKN